MKGLDFFKRIKEQMNSSGKNEGQLEFVIESASFQYYKLKYPFRNFAKITDYPLPDYMGENWIARATHEMIKKNSVTVSKALAGEIIPEAGVVRR